VGSIGELVAFTSEEVFHFKSQMFILILQKIILLQSHYSLAKAAHWIGLGTDNLIIVASDSSGKIIPAELKNKIVKALEQKKIPFFVNATAGTTVLGAYDPLEPLAFVCKKYDVWLHVDVSQRNHLKFN
jgi:glutamate/tyrosine decarboxylase-like PLP-dependent enzyme